MSLPISDTVCGCLYFITFFHVCGHAEKEIIHTNCVPATEAEATLLDGEYLSMPIDRITEERGGIKKAYTKHSNEQLKTTCSRRNIRLIYDGRSCALCDPKHYRDPAEPEDYGVKIYTEEDIELKRQLWTDAVIKHKERQERRAREFRAHDREQDLAEEGIMRQWLDGTREDN